MAKAVMMLGALLALAGCGSAGETCIPFKTCPKGGSMSSCCKPKAGGGNQCRYKLSDGTSVDCAGDSCGASDAEKANQWCSSH